jgi:hypothetical protein
VTPSTTAGRDAKGASTARGETRPSIADRGSVVAPRARSVDTATAGVAQPRATAAAASSAGAAGVPAAGVAAPSSAAGGPGPAPGGAFFFALGLAALSLAAALCFARLLAPPAQWRSVFVVSLIERPG